MVEITLCGPENITQWCGWNSKVAPGGGGVGLGRAWTGALGLPILGLDWDELFCPAELGRKLFGGLGPDICGPLGAGPLLKARPPSLLENC